MNFALMSTEWVGSWQEVVELVGREEMFGVESVGVGEEFWPWMNLAAAGPEMCVEQRNENLPGCSPLSELSFGILSLFHSSLGPIASVYPVGVGLEDFSIFSSS